MTSKITTVVSVIILISMICYLTKQAFNLAENVKPYNDDLIEGFDSGEKRLKRKGGRHRKKKRLSHNEDFMHRKDEADSIADKLDNLYDNLERSYKSMKNRSTNLGRVSEKIISLKKQIKKFKLKIKTIYPNYDFEDFNLREENVFKRYVYPYVDDGDNVICYNQDKKTCVDKKGCKWNAHYRECEKEESDSDSEGFWG